MKRNTNVFLAIENDQEFEDLALDTFHHQYAHNRVYRSYCDLLNVAPAEVICFKDIPYLPIRFFKTHDIKAFDGPAKQIFTSSGTTSNVRACHHLKDILTYQKSFETTFSHFYGTPKNWAILALLPSYLEREGSSLVYMMRHLIEQSEHRESGFYLNELEQLSTTLKALEKKQQPTLLLGVSFALLDFSEKYPLTLQSTTVMETGGMKGKRKELTREELHRTLQKRFGVNAIHSEYGMTELLSQAYAIENGRFYTPMWMRVTPYEINDPFSKAENGKIGRLNIVDLANQDSCAFIATDDLGKQHPDGSFEVMGRLDASDVRGCNLLVY